MENTYDEFHNHKIEIMFFIIGAILFVIGLYISMQESLNDSEPQIYNLVIILFGTIMMLFSWISITTKEERISEEKELKIKEEAKNVLLNDFKNGKELYIRVSRGFVTIPYVISTSNGWKLNENRFVLDNEHFTLDEVLQFQQG